MFRKKSLGKIVALVAMTAIAVLPGFGQESATVVDSAGRIVEIPLPVERVVVVNPPAAEVIAILGAAHRVVGVSGSIASRADLPVYAELPQVARSAHSEPDLEVILELAPQLVITYGTHGAVDTQGIADSLMPAGVPVIGIDAFRLDTLFVDILALGNVFESLPKAAELIVLLQSAIDTVTDELEEIGVEAPRVYAEHHGGGTFGPGSEWHTIINLARGDNIYADVRVPHFEADPEVTLQRDPEIVLFDTRGGPLGYGQTATGPVAGMLSEYLARPGWDALTAVQNRAAYIISTSIGAGPRKVFMVPYLAKMFYPELSVDPEALLREYHETFMGVPHVGIFVYPKP